VVGAVRWIWSRNRSCIVDYRLLDAPERSIGNYAYHFHGQPLQDRLVSGSLRQGILNIRGSAGRIACRPLAWKAATRIELGRASLTNALRAACLDRTEAGLLLGRKVVGSFVESARLNKAARHVCLSMVGRTTEAMSIAAMLCSQSMKLVNLVADSRNQLPRLVSRLPNVNRNCLDWTRASFDKSDGPSSLSIAIQYHDLQFQEIPRRRLLLSQPTWHPGD
jgi:hypothetical protein